MNRTMLGVTAALLIVLALLQLRWTADLAEAQRDQIRRTAQLDAKRFASAFDTELSSLFFYILSRPPALDQDPGMHFRDLITTWREDNKRLAFKAFLIDRSGVHGIDPDAPVDDVPMTADQILDTLLPPVPDHGLLLRPDWPAIIVPIQQGEPGRRHRRTPPDQIVLLLFDHRQLINETIPLLLSEALGVGAPDYRVQIDGATTTVYSESGSSLLQGEELVSQVFFRLIWSPTFREHFFAEHGPPGRRSRFGRFATTTETNAGGMTLLLFHAQGTLQEVVRRQRVMQLSIGLSILVLLGAAVVFVERARDRETKAAKAHMDFITGMTHELLTPVASLRSASQNLSDGVIDQPEKIKRYGQLMQGECHRLQAMVDQVLTFCRREESVRATRQPVDLNESLTRSLARYEDAIQARRWTVQWNRAKPAPIISADPEALRLLWDNIIGNAVKYAGDGNGIQLATQHDSSGMVTATIADLGPGVPESELASLATPFFRGAAHVASATPGSGLGLAIAANICVQHGALMTIKNTHPGLRVCISFPGVTP